jgi:hypothetical protein
MTFGLLNSLSRSKLYLLLYTPSTIFGPYIVRRTFLSKTSNRFSSLIVSNVPACTAGPGGPRSCRSLTLKSNVPGEITADIFAGRRSIYLKSILIVKTSRPKHTKKMILFFVYVGTHNNKILTIYKQANVFVLIFSMFLFWFY